MTKKPDVTPRTRAIDTVKTLSRLIKTICNNNMILAANNKVAQDAQEIINVFS